MNFSTHYSLRLLLWSIIFGLVIGLFGTTLAIIRIANFYIKEGASQNSDIYTYSITSESKKPLDNNALIEIKNTAGVGSALPYFSPVDQIKGSIDYFGFSASYPVQIKGIPKQIGEKKSTPQYQTCWYSADIEKIPVLLPKQAVTLYNNLAPQRSWPILNEKAFIGLPGLFLEIGNKKYQAIVTGFDEDEFGTSISAPAEKLFTIFEQQNLNPRYNSIKIETVPQITKKQVRETTKVITALGYELSSVKEENFQMGLFIRVKYTVAFLGFSMLIVFIILKFLNISALFAQLRKRIWLYRIWGIRDTYTIQIFFWSTIFSIFSGFLSWAVCFFVIIPAQDYMISTLTQFGINSPPIKESAKTALQAGVAGVILFFLINIITTINFYRTIPKAKYIKKF